MRIQRAYRRVVPEYIRSPLFSIRKKLNNPGEREWMLSRKRWISQFRVRRYRQKHRGERCFIIGNGPSLNRTDLSYLKNESTFGLNRIYLLFPTVGFSPTYYVSVNRLVIEQCAEEIERLPMPKFIGWQARNVISFTDNMSFVRDHRDSPLGFSTKPMVRIWEGHTVTYVAMQLAYFMGFCKVILIGVDHSFTTKGEPNKPVLSAGDDLDHFSPNYFGRGFCWQFPDLEGSEMAYRLAKQYFEADGREIVDATVGGRLEVFPKVDYQSLF